jgi:hypothetical protein
MQAVHTIPISFSSLYGYIIVFFVSGYFLQAPREYMHPGLVLGLDWASCQLPTTCIFFVCPGPPSILLFVPTIQASHMHPPLTTRGLNTSTQVNNMGMLHLIYNRHNYSYSTLSSYFFYTLGQAGWPWPLMSGPGVVTMHKKYNLHQKYNFFVSSQVICT